jgi:hypothetical protein
MKTAILAALGLAAVLASASRAAEPAKPDNDQSVLLSPIAVPVVVNGRIANYVFVTVKVLLTPNADAYALNDKEPYFRDALVRAAHRRPFFTLPNDYDHIDQGKLDAALFRDAQAIVGPGKILRVQVIDQTPQHNLPAPH